MQHLTDADVQTSGGPKLSREMVEYFAGHICTRFNHDFVEALKHDLQTDGKAYAAVSLRFFAEILTNARKSGQTIQEFKSLLEKMPQLLNDLQRAVDHLRQSGLPAKLDALS